MVTLRLGVPKRPRGKNGKFLPIFPPRHSNLKYISKYLFPKSGNPIKHLIPVIPLDSPGSDSQPRCDFLTNGSLGLSRIVLHRYITNISHLSHLCPQRAKITNMPLISKRGPHAYLIRLNMHLYHIFA